MENKTKYITPLLMLFAGAVASIIMFVREYDLYTMLWTLLIVLIVFFVIGDVARYLYASVRPRIMPSAEKIDAYLEMSTLPTDEELDDDDEEMDDGSSITGEELDSETLDDLGIDLGEELQETQQGQEQQGDEEQPQEAQGQQDSFDWGIDGIDGLDEYTDENLDEI